MVPEGSDLEDSGVDVLVDATRAGCGRRLFGMSLLEHALRALLDAGLEGARVWLQENADEPWPLPADLAGKSTRLRLERVSGAAPLAKRVAEAAGQARVLLVLEADAVVDPRLLVHLLGRPGSCAVLGTAPVPGVGKDSAVLRLEGPPLDAPEARDLASLARAWIQDGRIEDEPAEAIDGYVKKLRRHLTPWVFRPVSVGDRDRCERFLFEANYKGSTDFFTKHVYPPLVWQLVRPLARYRVHPNWVSAFNVVITFAAIPLFAAGQWIAGLTLAYTMSVLDSVDGKLARLTHRASKLGHVLDHGLDVVHPPLWYLAWAIGLGGGGWVAAAWWMIGLYVADRLVGEAFTRMTGGRSIHAWAEVDVRMRTFISRRNINLPLFTLGLLLGLAGPAFLAIVAWQGATLLFHSVRLAQVAREIMAAPTGGAA
ncbi:MAG: CDP-alcohol phosphatidyltransferase family protein [Deltaproteobacteria bacterium]|nr:CDP-alcohol phosphatidyltransferase family protein [Deltaproteobacteria bacterium]MBW2396123.1 CDP-alcohol phosphatidyltransferase family protein [Deltaproteobacteria bacterium]